MRLCFSSLLMILVCGLIWSQNENPPIIFKDLNRIIPHDENIEFRDANVLFENGKIVGVETSYWTREQIAPEIPEIETVSRIYFGYDPDRHGVIREFDESEFQIIFSIIRRFSFRRIYDENLYKVEDASRFLEVEEPKADEILIHMCTLGVHFVLKDGSMFTIDGHEDEESFSFKQEPYTVFSNYVLNSLLIREMENYKRENK